MSIIDQGLGLFGYSIQKKPVDTSVKPALASFVPKTSETGGTEINSYANFSTYSLNFDPSQITDYGDLVNKYREISLVSEIDIAISEIIDEVVSVNSDERICKIDFDQDLSKGTSKKTKDLIIAEFEYILSLLNFESMGHEIMREMYIDGSRAYHKIIDKTNPKDGIKELRAIDVARLKKIIEIKKQKDPATGVDIIVGQDEYFVYADTQTKDVKTGLKITTDAIAYTTCGLLDRNNNRYVSYLHKAIRPLNQLRMMEDSDVIYRMTRAPERRVFNIDTSGMSRSKGEQYIQEVMNRYKNKVAYDAATGAMRTDKKHTSIIEDYWFPRGNNGKGTSIDTLPGGQGLGSIENTEYFQNKLYLALNIPSSRLQPQQGAFSLGRASEITRDEVKFAKFIERIRRRFNIILLDVLKTQLILKGITTADDWDQVKTSMKIIYAADNFWAELKDVDLFRDRLQTVAQADAFVGKYFSAQYIKKDILKMTDEEIERVDGEMEEEAKANQALQDQLAAQSAAAQQDGQDGQQQDQGDQQQQ